MDSFSEVIPDKDIILFDGTCNLCNSSVQFIIKRDTRQQFLFAPLQSKTATQRLGTPSPHVRIPKTIILLRGNTRFDRSDAVLEIVKKLSGAWPLFALFQIVPKPIRDGMYNWVARNRYRFFGKPYGCMIPTSELKARFLD